MLETWLGIICACVPLLQKQFGAQGVYGSKIIAGWSKIASRKSMSSGPSASMFASGSSQHKSQGTETVASKGPPNSMIASEIGVSRSYNVSYSEKTFLDSSSV